MPQIEIPRFRFGDKDQGGGPAKGDGKPGRPGLGQPPGDPQDGEGQAGNQAGNDMLEVDLTLQGVSRDPGRAIGAS